MKKILEYRKKYSDVQVITCGYGRENIENVKKMNELSALAKGVFYVTPEEHIILDIGGQDTKIISQEAGNLKQFFLNDKCAAGSGQFLANVCNMLNMALADITLLTENKSSVHLSSVCAVFAQSEIVELIAADVDENRIVSAVVRQIFTQVKPLIGKLTPDNILISGGMSNIKNLGNYASSILGRECIVHEKGQFLAAIGGALSG